MSRSPRYPGPKAFEAEQQHIFFGRDKEADQLFAMVKQRPLVVLFAKSGIGKSSLINAGLNPKLELEGYLPFVIRLRDTQIDPAKATKAALAEYLDEEKLKAQTDQTKESAGLWEFLRACEFHQFGEPVMPVLIFDQFEEYFSHAPETRQEFTPELGHLIGSRLPKRVLESLRSTPPDDRTPEFDSWHQPISLRIIFAIRSDRISHLDEMKFDIPAILKDRFHLKPLAAEQARDAIVNPANLEFGYFDCPTFKFHDDSLDIILQALTGKNEEIESFQLQLICQRLEQRIIEGSLSLENGLLKPAAFGGKAGIQQIIDFYYEDTIASLAADEQLAAKRFLEEGLIFEGRRIGLAEGLEQDRFGIDKSLLDFLLEKRLIRPEINSFGKSYEVSHDAFVKPMLASLALRKEKEELERQAKERERLEAERLKQEKEEADRERLETETRLRREAEEAKEVAVVAREDAEASSKRAKMFSYISLAIAGLTLAFGIYGWQSKVAYHGLLGRIFQEEELYEQAIEQYKTAKQLGIFPSERLDSIIAMANYRKNQFIPYMNFKVQGDSLADLGAFHLDEAKQFYLKANKLEYEPRKIESKQALKTIDELIRLNLYKYKDKARIFINARAWEQAATALNVAAKLDPTDEEVERMQKEVGSHLRE